MQKEEKNMEPPVNWSPEETQALIGVWSEGRIQRDLEESCRNESVYREVSGRLAAMGVSRSAKQCRQKIKKLKQEYRKIKSDCEGSGHVRETFRWYDAMDTVMNDSPAATEDRDPSDTMILEFMISDVERESPSITEMSQSLSTPRDVATITTPDHTRCSMEIPQEPRCYSIKLQDCDGPSTSTTETSAAGKTSAQDKPMRSWSNKEVRTLLTLWANPAVQRELGRNVRNNQIYAGFSAELASLGFNKPPQKCREKIKKLKQEYKRIKSGHPIGGSSKVWFAIMDEVLSSQGAAAKHSETAELSSTVSSSPSQSVGFDMDMDDEIQWLPDEVQVLMTLWAQPNIQKQLLSTATSDHVYTYLSSELELVGFNKTPHQCYLKVNDLKEEYKRIKQMENCSDVKGDWFAILDSVVEPDGEELKELDSSAVMTESPNDEYVNESPTITDFPGTSSMPCHILPFTTPGSTPCYMEDLQEPSFYSVKLEDCDGPSTSTRVASAAAKTSVKDKPMRSWSDKEVQTLLTLWANPTVQRELGRNVRNNQVYAVFSAELASLGFNKPPRKCREKIKKLKQEYKRIKSGHPIGGSSKVWFAIMDEVLSSQGTAAKRLEKANPSSTVSSSPSQSVDFGVDMDDEIQWLPDEVQVLMTLWAQPNIQKQLLSTATSDHVYTYLSNELELVGFNKTPHQCYLKVNDLKEEYKRIKQMENYSDVKGDWFAILDSVVEPDGETSKELDSSAVTTEAKPPGSERATADAPRAVWTSEEVKELLSRWAEESIQEQLRSTQKTERAYAQLSSALATRGFDKTTSQCRSKIRVLKQRYKRVKEQKDSRKQKSRWFAIMDNVLARRKSGIETKPAAFTHSNPGPRQASQASLLQELCATVEGCRLSVPSLCLLVPTLRLMCAFAWQVIRSSNVMHYGKVEELVRSATELAPELLTPREKTQLLLRLRARLVLDLCLRESTANLLNIQPHLKVIQDLTISSGCDQEELEELEKSKSNFVGIVFALLEDTEERRRFFKEVFPVYYGQEYEVTLHTLVWKFISRLDNLLPSPDIKQTAEWLSTSDALLEECSRLVLEPDQLKELLHFSQQQSAKKKCFSQVQNMFLPLLSLRPKANSDQQEEATANEEDEELLDGESVGENQTDDTQVLGDYSKGNEDVESANCSNLNPAPLQLQPCSLCPYSDGQVPGLLEHIRKEHLFQESSRPPSSEHGKGGDFQKVSAQDLTPVIWGTTDTCKYCAKVFKDISTLNSHIKTHTLPFRCDQCDKKYSSRASLTVHRRIHTGETPYLCSHCGQGFRSSNSLGLHVRIHTGDRRHKCPICGKTSIQHLTRHMRMHRGEKNYLCSECGKAFLSSGELRLHMRFHTGERPYACKHCGRGFIAKCLLTVHMRQHTGESPYKCLLCPKSFHTLRAQKRHMMIHSNRKSFQCLKCGRIFRHEGTFKIHVDTHR